MRGFLKLAGAAAAASLIVGAAAHADRTVRLRLSESDIASAAEDLGALDFVASQRLGVEDRLISAQPGDIPGMLLVRLPGDDYWNPYSILSDAERTERVTVGVLDREQGNYVDLNFREGTSFGTDGSPLSFLAGLLGVQVSNSYRTRFRFEPVMTARGPAYGPGEPELSQKVDDYAQRFLDQGFEAYYVNSVDIYRSVSERYAATENSLSAGFAFVAGGNVYSLESGQTRQRLHYVVNAVRVLPFGPGGNRMTLEDVAEAAPAVSVSDADARAAFARARAAVESDAAALGETSAGGRLAAALGAPAAE